jgi:hypothetical protein
MYPELSPEVLEILERNAVGQEKSYIWQQSQEFKSKERENRWATKQKQEEGGGPEG